MKTWMWVILIVALAAAGYFLYRHGTTDERAKAEKQLEDTVSVLNAKFVKDLNDCWEKVIQQVPPIHTPIFTTRKKLSHDDSVKITQIMSFATQGKLDSLLAVVEKLSAPKSGQSSFEYEDDNIVLSGVSLAENYPLESDTIAVVTFLEDVRLKSLPRDTVVVSVRDDSKPFIGRVCLLTDWDWIFNKRRSEFEMAIGLPVNIFNVTVMPKVGHHSILKLGVGLNVRYEF